MKNQVEIFLEDISYNTKYEFLDMGKDQNELQTIAQKCRIKLPCNDLAIFKGTYAYVDRQNKNGCTLIKAEVEKALDTLIGKAVDFDHFRKRVVGHWIDAKLEGDTIIAYGVFFKGNFYDDYADVKQLMESDKLGISFEAWGTKEMKTASTYNLNEIEFAGGALLMKEQPAFDGAEVLEMAKERVLEFASVMTKPTTFIHTEGESKIEQSAPVVTDNYIHVRNIPKERFEQNSFRTITLSEPQGIKAIIGNLKGETKTTIHAYLFDTKKFSTKEAEDWVTKHKGSIEITEATVVIKEVEQPIADGTTKDKEQAKTTEKDVIMSKIDYSQQPDDMMHCMKCPWSGPADELTDNTCPECKGPVEPIDEMPMDDEEQGAKLTYKQKQNISDDLFAVIKEVKNKVTGEPRKIRMFPIADPAHVRNALARLAQTKVHDTLRSLGVSIDSVKQKILKRARELNMNDLLARYEKSTVEEQAKLFKETLEEVAKLKTDSEAKDKEFATLKESITAKDAELATLKTELETVKKTAETATAEIARRDKEIRDAEIAKRKTELGDVAKDMTDEDVMNEDKYKIAKLTKENADLKAQVEATAKAAAEKAAAAPAAEPAKASTEQKPEADLDKGSKDKKKDTEVFTAQKRITEKAFGKETKE